MSMYFIFSLLFMMTTITLEKAFIILLFTKTDEIGVIPSNWLTDKTHCVWPDFKSQIKINNTIIHSEQPGDWATYEIKVISTSCNYQSGYKLYAVCFSDSFLLHLEFINALNRAAPIVPL